MVVKRTNAKEKLPYYLVWLIVTVPILINTYNKLSNNTIITQIISFYSMVVRFAKLLSLSVTIWFQIFSWKPRMILCLLPILICKTIHLMTIFAIYKACAECVRSRCYTRVTILIVDLSDEKDIIFLFLQSGASWHF